MYNETRGFLSTVKREILVEETIYQYVQDEAFSGQGRREGFGEAGKPYNAINLNVNKQSHKTIL